MLGELPQGLLQRETDVLLFMASPFISCLDAESSRVE
jgi:hypothetical protein